MVIDPLYNAGSNGGDLKTGGNRPAIYAGSNGGGDNLYTLDNICKMIKFLIANILAFCKKKI